MTGIRAPLLMQRLSALSLDDSTESETKLLDAFFEKLMRPVLYLDTYKLHVARLDNISDSALYVSAMLSTTLEVKRNCWCSN